MIEGELKMDMDKVIGIFIIIATFVLYAILYLKTYGV